MDIEPSCKEMEKLKGDGATGDVNCDTDPSPNQFCVSSEDLESSYECSVCLLCYRKQWLSKGNGKGL